MIYDQAIKMDLNYAKAYRARGFSKYDLGQNKEAIADYDQAIKIDSNNANAYYNRGSAKYALQDTQNAITDYQKSADLYKQQGKTSDYQNAIYKIKILSPQ